MDCSRRISSSRPRGRIDIAALLAAGSLSLGASSCGHADPSRAAGDVPAAAGASTAELLCIPSDTGYLRARLQGAIDAELDWASAVPQCRGGLRPTGDGVRLLFKGPGTGPADSLLIVMGIGPLRPGESRTQVPVNLTLVQEGVGQFFATQGDDKCAMDEVHQESRGTTLFRLTGRGYCTQPARAVQGDGAVLVSRFDVEALVDFAEAMTDATYARTAR
jgi:hypothetical protein